MATEPSTRWISSPAGDYRTRAYRRAIPGFRGGLTFSPKGVLYAINSSLGRGVQANLITIDTQTGKVTNKGALPNDTESLNLRPAIEHKDMLVDLMEWRTPLMVALFLFALVMLVVLGRPPKSP